MLVGGFWVLCGTIILNYRKMDTTCYVLFLRHK
jgi:hypothetical protein